MGTTTRATRPCLIGLTGGIGSGKSVAARILQGLGAAVIDIDALVHRLQAPGQEVWRAIRQRWGWPVLGPGGELDRRRLGLWAFSDEAVRRGLEAIVHPAAAIALREAVDALAAAGARRIVVEVPLLVEAGWQGMVDQVWLVYAPPGQRLKRIMVRDGLDPASAQARLAAQMPLEAKRGFADWVINNTGARQDLERALTALWHQLDAEC